MAHHHHDHSLAGIMKMKAEREPVRAKRDAVRKLLENLRQREADFIKEHVARENLMEKTADEWLSTLLQLKIRM